MLKLFIVALWTCITMACSPSAVYAAEWEIATTATLYGKTEDGIYYQKGTGDYTIKNKLPGLYVGRVYGFENTDRLHVGIWYGGHATVDALATTDDGYKNGVCLAGCDRPQHFNTQSNIWMLQSLYEDKRSLYSVPFSLYYGGSLMWVPTTITVPDWKCLPDATGDPDWCGPTYRQVKGDWQLPYPAFTWGIGKGPFSFLITYPIRSSGRVGSAQDGMKEHVPAAVRGPAYTLKCSYYF